jgi:hypothetical protein
MNLMKIFCPKCKWKPRRHDLWACHPGCGHIWHTFDTRGQCPACRKQWRDTACLACSRWSKHEDWYHDDNPDETLRFVELVSAPVEEEVTANATS